MAFPNLSVPKFPNVPKVAGVPPMLRDPVNFAANQLTGTIQSKVNFVTGQVTGTVAGVINQASGLVTQVSGGFSAAIDVATGNVAGSLRATVLGGGSVTAGISGRVLGAINMTTGALSGTIRSSLSNVVGSLVGRSGDGLALAGQPVTPVWGLYDANGQLALAADNVVAFDYRQEKQLSDFPVEEGGFETYNKVTVPQECRLQFTKGGTEADRTEFLIECAAIVDSLDLFSAVTPEVTYSGLNAHHLDYSRKREKGATLLTVDIWLSEIRITATAAYTQTKTPAGASPVSGGAVLPRAPTPFQAAAIGEGL